MGFQMLLMPTEIFPLSSPVMGAATIRPLLRKSIVHPEDWEALPSADREMIEKISDTPALLKMLVARKLLTEYQRDRIEAGSLFGLVLGNYRVTDRLGAGGMGVVFKAEHITLRREVAIKVIAFHEYPDCRIATRFQNEMRAVASLNHPNIVAAIDAGVLDHRGDGEVLRYFVMELVRGHDLEELVSSLGPMSTPQACGAIYQIAAALSEAHKHLLVHRDIKPANIRMTPDGIAKLLDFGLARTPSNRLTEPGMMLGTVDFMAPEQARDASRADARSDLYSLGCTLYWCLTGQPPFTGDDRVYDIASRAVDGPPSILEFAPELPVELDCVVRKMMACNAEDRYQTPQDVMEALVPFLRPDGRTLAMGSPPSAASIVEAELDVSQTVAPIENVRKTRTLIVDDDPGIQTFCRMALASEGMDCDAVSSGEAALETLRARPFDLVVLDIELPNMTGMDVLKALRSAPPSPHLKIVMMSGRVAPDDLARAMLAGADDFLSKPIAMTALISRLKAALRLKEAQDRADEAARRMFKANQELKQMVVARTSEMVASRNALLASIAKLTESRDVNGDSHLRRMGAYCRCLAAEAARLPAFAEIVDETFLELIENCAPLHDLGMIGLPDHILRKPGKLELDERLIMQTHTVVGSELLRSIIQHHGAAAAFLNVAADIVRSHHEWWDGTGYPDGLREAEIPLAARIAAVADVYDALRSHRPHKPALNHAAAVRIMTTFSQGQFDPELLVAFKRCAPQFEEIERQYTD